MWSFRKNLLEQLEEFGGLEATQLFRHHAHEGGFLVAVNRTRPPTTRPNFTLCFAAPLVNKFMSAFRNLHEKDLSQE